MSILDTLITDRIDGATYNWSDFNRVAEAMQYVAARLRACGWNIVVSPKGDWTRDDRPTLSAMQQYVGILEKLRSTLRLFAGTPAVPQFSKDKNWLEVSEANDIEKILLAIEDMVQRTIDAYYYCGEVYAGEV